MRTIHIGGMLPRFTISSPRVKREEKITAKRWGRVLYLKRNRERRKIIKSNAEHGLQQDLSLP